jgi:GMC oxidoreductase
MGKNTSEGVVNTMGKVFKNGQPNSSNFYDGLYVVDGSIPTAIGVKPSLTISALAFRIA